MNNFEILLAMCIGDGHITDNNRLVIRHSMAQEQYALLKKQQLEQILEKDIQHYYYNYNNYPSIQYSVTDSVFIVIRNMLYPNGIKYISNDILNLLTPLCLAIWYMDDGSLSKKIRDGIIHGYELSISTYCSEQEADIIVNYFLNVWNVNFSKRFNKGKYTIRCGTKEARKFIEIIKPFIHPSLFYKIDIGIGHFTLECLI